MNRDEKTLARNQEIAETACIAWLNWAEELTAHMRTMPETPSIVDPAGASRNLRMLTDHLDHMQVFGQAEAYSYGIAASYRQAEIRLDDALLALKQQP